MSAGSAAKLMLMTPLLKERARSGEFKYLINSILYALDEKNIKSEQVQAINVEHGQVAIIYKSE